MRTYPAHAGNHALPVSNGYGYGPDGMGVYCGRCGDVFRPDADWATRYFTARRRRLEQTPPHLRTDDAFDELTRREADVIARLSAP